MTDLAAPYLNLVKTSVLGELYDENELRSLYLRDCANRREAFDGAVAARYRAQATCNGRRVPARALEALYDRVTPGGFVIVDD
jgi:hypothetical protein